MIIADIDHFKRINDEHGHARADAVLMDVAYAMRKELRAYDLAYRLGGEEFLILVPGAEQSHVDALGSVRARRRTALPGQARRAQSGLQHRSGGGPGRRVIGFRARACARTPPAHAPAGLGCMHPRLSVIARSRRPRCG